MQKTKKNGALIVTAVIIPACLLTVFIMTRQEPPTPEIITLEAVSWNMSRPANYIIIDDTDERVENSYINSVTSARLGVHICSYHENELGVPSYGNDYVKFVVTTTANVSVGYIQSMVVNFSGTDAYAFIDIVEDPDAMELHGVKMEKVRDPWTHEYEAYARASGIGRPKECSMSIVAWWIFTDGNSVDHWVTVTSEVTYFNGTAYERVIMPIQLGVLTS